MKKGLKIGCLSIVGIIAAIILMVAIGVATTPSPETTEEAAPKVTESQTDQTETEVVEEETVEEEVTEEEVAEETPAEPEVSTEFKAALAQAKTYSDMMAMSKAGVYDQLVSEYGGKFPAEAAQYAIDNVDADWNANALEKAKTYQETMNMSTEAIRDQLTSEYGEKFTAEEADYAIQNLE